MVPAQAFVASMLFEGNMIDSDEEEEMVSNNSSIREVVDYRVRLSHKDEHCFYVRLKLCLQF